MDMRLHSALMNLEVTEPVTVDRLQAFGLRWRLPGELTYLTLDEALSAEALEVTEISEAGSVPELKAVNKGDSMVLLLAGDMLVGAKQNRVLNASLMVPARSETAVPVSCVEKGRWGYRSRKFGGALSGSHSKLKRMMARMAAEGYRKSGKPESNQGEVWHEVDRKLYAMKSASPTYALEQAFADRQSKLDECVAGLHLPEDCCGVAFAFDGRLVGVELFDVPQTLAKVLPKLVRAYVLDAMEYADLDTDEPEKVEKPTLKELLFRMFSKPIGAAQSAAQQTAAEGKHLARAEVGDRLRAAAEFDSETFASPGLGQDVRFEGRELVGACLMVEDRPVHVELLGEWD